MEQQRKDLNYLVLMVFAPVLILAGIGGFIMPTELSSSAPAYNIFHIFFGVVGLALVLLKRLELIRAFNIGFGVIDLYQAVASFLHLFPESYFRWLKGDDILHIVIGAALILVGIFGQRNPSQADGNSA